MTQESFIGLVVPSDMKMPSYVMSFSVDEYRSELGRQLATRSITTKRAGGVTVALDRTHLKDGLPDPNYRATRTFGNVKKKVDLDEQYLRVLSGDVVFFTTDRDGNPSDVLQCVVKSINDSSSALIQDQKMYSSYDGVENRIGSKVGERYEVCTAQGESVQSHRV